jgi:hypothetical protein
VASEHDQADINGARPTRWDVKSPLPKKKDGQLNTLKLTWFQGFLCWMTMTAMVTRWCWRKDLSEFRGLSERERAGFLVFLEWFENFRLRHELAAGREAAKVFWRSEVIREDHEREKWSGVVALCRDRHLSEMAL